MQTTNLNKIPVITYPLHTQLLLARRPTAPSSSSYSALRSKAKEAQGSSISAVEEDAPQKGPLEVEERLFQDYLAQLVAWDDVDQQFSSSERLPEPSFLAEEVRLRSADEAALAPALTQAPADRAARRPSFHLRFTLRFKTEDERLYDATSAAAANACKTLPSKLHTLILSFAHDKTYEPLESVHVPYLCRDPLRGDAFDQANAAKARRRGPQENGTLRSGDAADADESRPPYVYDLKITLRPLAPLPTSFAVCATFNDEDGNICEGQMDPIRVEITDIFLPIQLPPSFSVLDSSVASREDREAVVSALPSNGEGARSLSRSLDSATLMGLLWRRLWRHLSATPDNRYAPFLLSSPLLLVNTYSSCPAWRAASPSSTSTKDATPWPNSYAAASDGSSWKRVRGCSSPPRRCNSSRMMTSVSEGIDLSDEEDEETSWQGDEELEVMRLMIFLPPRYHLLIRASMRDKSTVLDIRYARLMIPSIA